MIAKYSRSVQTQLTRHTKCQRKAGCQVVMRWRPLTDLPTNWHDLASTELPALAGVWSEQKQRLADSDTLKQFNERLRRECAIETGLIENLYTIDRGTTQLLIEQGFHTSLIPHGATDKPADYVTRLLRSQVDAIEGLFEFVALSRHLSTSYIKQLHQVLTQHQEDIEAIDHLGRRTRVPLIQGNWKKWPNNPERPDGSIHEYCPPEQVASEIDQLISFHREHIELDVPPEVEAAWLHHRFTQIHPFQDGNGRVVRCLSSLILLRADWFPLNVSHDQRGNYITALENADRGNLALLIDIIVGGQRSRFVQALSLSREVLREHGPVRTIISAAGEKLRDRRAELEQERRQVFSLARTLEDFTHKRLEDVRVELYQELATVAPNIEVFVDAASDQDMRDHYFRSQIIDAAKKLEYFANTRTYRSWIRLVIKEHRQPVELANSDDPPSQTEILLSFHGIGQEFRGVLGASAMTFRRELDEDRSTQISAVDTLSESVFQLNYYDEEQIAKARFGPWLEDSIIVGLRRWQDQL